MATLAGAAPRLTSVVARPESAAGALYRLGREQQEARAPGFASEPGLNLRFYGGKTIGQLTFTHVYLGGKASWSPDDVTAIDRALPAALSDPHLENVIAQYFPGGRPTATFVPSRFLEEPCPARVYRNTIEALAASLDASNGFSGFDLGSSVFCFMLPPGVVLVDGDSSGRETRHPGLGERDEAVDSQHGLGGYHGSIHPKRGAPGETVYYAVGVYSEGGNGIAAFPQPWESVCATFYHEVNEARTDPDVEDAIRAGDSPSADRFLGWYSPRGGEIGDIPMEEAGADLSEVMKIVPLANGGTAPVQLMWSNAVGGPEGPIAMPDRAAAK
jgi:hypothetical protein